MDCELLEGMRVLHERRDRLEMAIADEMMVKRTGHKDQLDSQHRQKRLLDRYMACSKELMQMYKRETTRPDHNKSAHQACNEFYDEYNKLLSAPGIELDDEPIDIYSERTDDYPVDTLLEPSSVAVVLPGHSGKSVANTTEAAVGATAVATTPAATVEKLVEFSDEEGHGRYFDLNACHEAFLQVVKNQEIKPNYLTFLTKFDQFHREIERERKTSSAYYKHYVEAMLNYFRDYSRRARPLFDYEEMESKTQEKFLEQWKSRSFLNWFSEADAQQAELPSEPMVDLSTYQSVEQLMELGLDCLKRELQIRELKCGGTLEDRAKRLWSVRGKRPEEIDDSLKATAASSLGGGGGGGGSKKGKKKKKVQIEPKYIASIEAKIAAYAEYFSEQRQATIENVQRKQARTADERNESDDEFSDIEDDDESDHDDVIYNPKGLPLGWDGKPIPYWLFRLHGLNQTFTCEICGNATYKGPKAFQRHFAEQRHAHGMKCLGIPNTAHFANITSIQDAMTLWEKLKQERQKDQFQPQVEEEYEDSQGNVVNRKTYEDLKRQGLL